MVHSISFILDTFHWLVVKTFMYNKIRICTALVVFGITYTFGMFLGEFMKTFDSTRTTTSMIASIQMGVTFFVGPIAAYLVRRFSCREIAIAGSIIAATSIIISGVAPNIATLYITAGFFTGNLCNLK